MSFIRNIVVVIFVTAVLFLGADFLLTALKLDPISQQNNALAFVTGMRHDVYHHDLKPNLDNEASWGDNFYRLCTNEYAFKISCDDKGKPTSKSYDIAFMGDSFTEGVGMAYEDSFVGLFAQNNPSLSVVNLGVASYSPSIFYAKIVYLLQQGFTFKHVIVGADISDIGNEGVLYTLEGDRVVEKQKVTSSGIVQKQQEDTVKSINVFEKYFKYTWFINLIIYEYFYPTRVMIKNFDVLSYQSNWTHADNPPNYGDKGVEGAIAQNVTNMTKLKNLLDAHNIKMSVLVYPWPAQLIYVPKNHRGVTLWKEFCERENCANFIDANPLFYKEMDETSLEDVLHNNYLLGDFHYNKNGNALVYKAIEQQFKMR